MIEKTHEARLCELLREVCDIQKCGFGPKDPTYKAVADYLIANGVLVPPVAVGQTVYVVDKSRITDNVVREIYIYRSKKKFEIRMHISLSNTRVGLLYGEENINQIVFLTYEEAEAKLKEKEGMK